MLCLERPFPDPMLFGMAVAAKADRPIISRLEPHPPVRSCSDVRDLDMVIGLTRTAGMGANELAMRWRYKPLGTLFWLRATGRQQFISPKTERPNPSYHGDRQAALLVALRHLTGFADLPSGH